MQRWTQRKGEQVCKSKKEQRSEPENSREGVALHAADPSLIPMIPDGPHNPIRSLEYRHE